MEDQKNRMILNEPQKNGNAGSFALTDEFDSTRTHVRIDPEKKTAWLYLVDKEDGTFYTKADLRRILEENGVVYGINEDFLIAMAKKRVYEREIKVASAKEPIEGKNGYYEYFVDVSEEKRKPRIREDGSVDYQSMNAVISVKEGDKLALYHPPVEGTPGTSVTGGELSVAPVKELPAIQGKNIVRSEENPNLYLAEKEGRVEYKDGRLILNAIYELNGDVDQLIGKIEFYGDVIISGNVESGVIIRAGKNLTIDGTVEAATIVVGGDVVLKRGIQGSQKATIICKGNLYADFIEHTQVRAGGSVQANTIISSQIEAEGMVTVTGKKGAIIGGYVHGYMGISCQGLGNESEVKTVVHAGCPPETYQKHTELCKQRDKIKKDQQAMLEELKNIEGIIKRTGTIAPHYEKRLREIKQEKKQLDEELSGCNDKLAAIMASMQMTNDVCVRIDGCLYRGAVVYIGQGRLPIQNNTVYMEYRNISGMITGKVIVKN